MKTTFWQDFSIAETFGADAIKNTAEKCFNEWKDDIEYLTELIYVINHKAWRWNEVNDEYMELYSDLYYKYNDMALDYISKNLPKEALEYYYTTLD